MSRSYVQLVHTTLNYFILGKVLNTYKGATGSIRCVKCHNSLPVVAACGLDRFIRIYNLEDKKLLNQVCFFNPLFNSLHSLHLDLHKAT